jgi:transcription-repair coupling factor (superfamily II helicase)
VSTLYQLRGRVGRSTRQAFAYFMTPRNSSSLTVEAEQRLTYVKTFTALGSGYELSRRDMEMRGSGTLFGADQSGSQDIGLDLQASMLAKALEEIKSKNKL